MKKSLVLLLSAFLLVSCGDPNVDANGTSSPIEESPSATSEATFFDYLDSIEATHRYAAHLFYSIVSDSGEEKLFSYGIQEQYGDEALLWMDEEDPSVNAGVLINGDQGVFDYSIQDGQILVEGFSFFDGGYGIGELYDSPVSFTSHRLWYEDEENLYHTNSNSIAASVASLTGLADLENSYGIELTAGSVYGSVSEDGQGIELSMETTMGGQVVAKGYITITDIGTASNEVVENYLESPTVFKAKTGWSEEDNAVISQYFSATLPFPEGATYTLSVSGLSSHGEVLIADCASGDLSSSYKAQLESNGYTVTYDTDHSMYVAEKSVTESQVITEHTVYFTFFSKSTIAQLYGEETASLYPYGRFQIEAYSSSTKINTYEEGIAALAKYEDFPTPSFNGVSHCVIADYSDSYAPYLSVFVLVDFYCEDQATALQNLTAYVQTLISLGYVADSASTDYDVILQDSSVSTKKKIEIALSLSSTGVYQGYFEVAYIAQ
ncbi:MAG: hypothetical protein SPG64_01600 [Candidatus Enteromonas sp.]|nr:hypothetical protein [Candidatus Enteromonas sp.]